MQKIVAQESRAVARNRAMP